MVDPWRVLGIGPTGDQRAIKKAYAARLKRANPEDDPQGFQQLREAYELAIGFARWQEAQKGKAEPPVQEAQPPEPPPPGLTPQPVDSQWSPDATSRILAQALRLIDDPQRRYLEADWRELLTAESLWHVDTRQALDRSLCELLVRRDARLTPAIWCLLEEQFHWSEQAVALYRMLPRDAVDRLLERLERAPLEHAEELCDRGRWSRARSLLEPIVSDRATPTARARAAQHLLDRCNRAELAAAIIREVERLRSDERAWSSVEEWRTLLGRPELREGDTRRAFQKSLFEFLVQRGQGLSTAVWQLLDGTYHWSKQLPAPDLGRALEGALGPTLVTALEELHQAGRHQEVLSEWPRVLAKLDGEWGRRGRRVVELCCLATIGRAQALSQQDRHREAIDEITPVVGATTGELSSRAISVLVEAAEGILSLAKRLGDQRRHGEAIQQIGPVVGKLKFEVGRRARLQLADCYFHERNYGKAEHYLKEVLREDPLRIRALLLLAAVHHARGHTRQAMDGYRQVLTLEPENEAARLELRALEKQEQQAEGNRSKPEHSANTGGEIGASLPIAILMALSSLRSCNAQTVKSIDAPIILAFLIFLSVVCGLAFGLSAWRRRQAESEVGVSLRRGARATQAGEGTGRRWRVAFSPKVAAVAVGVGLVAVVIWAGWGAARSSRARRAEPLRAQGFAALDKGDYAKAASLLQSAAAEDPRLPDVHEGVGRALHELGRPDEAIGAFTRQIDLSPRHERAYAWRAHVNMARERWSDAEKDLEKQIEVAPSQVWSHERLGHRRMSQSRFVEAVALFERAAALEPKRAGRWLDLGRAHAGASNPADARRCLEKMMGLEPEESMMLSAAGVHRMLGGLHEAEMVARAALQPLNRRLSDLRPDTFSEKDQWWVNLLVDAWTHIGRGATERGDFAEADRNLEAAWRLSLSPDAASTLGELRFRQGRTVEANRLKFMMRSILTRAETVGVPLSAAASRQRLDPGSAVDALRTVHLSGPALGELSEEALLLVDAEGRVEAIKKRAKGDSTTFDSQVRKLKPIRFAPFGPLQESTRIVRKGRINCTTSNGCVLVLDLPPIFRFSPPGFVPQSPMASVLIVSLGPTEGLPFKPDQQVTLSATLQYSLKAGQGVIKLLALAQPGGSTTEVASAKVSGPMGRVTLEGSYRVPKGVSRIDIAVPLESTTHPTATATAGGAFFAVESR